MSCTVTLHAAVANTASVLQALQCLHSDDHQWRRFVHRWSQPALSNGGTEVSCMLALVHGDVEDDKLWMRYLEHAAQVCLLYCRLWGTMQDYEEDCH